jgi:hypothetical protein
MQSENLEAVMLKPFLYCLLFVLVSGPIGAAAYVALALIGF